jgi:hypothetical protein
MRFEEKMGPKRRRRNKKMFFKLKKLFFFGFIIAFPLPFKDGFQNLR